MPPPPGISSGYQFRCADGKVTFDEFYQAPIERFENLDQIDWTKFAPNSRTRIIVQASPDILPLDLLFIPRESSRLLVGFHGAENRRTLQMPKFQFVSSFLSREESLLFVSDSTLLNGPKINIGWVAGNKDIHIGSMVTKAINQIVNAHEYQETVLAGHSAGGFSAILVGSQIPNSRAISVNGQSVAVRYAPWTVANLQKEAFPETKNIEEMAEKYADRLDLRVVLENRISSSSFTMFGNTNDKASFGPMPHFPLLAEHFGLTEAGGRTDHGDALVACTWALKSGGHALPGTIIPFISYVLGEEPSVPIETTVDPRWYR